MHWNILNLYEAKIDDIEGKFQYFGLCIKLGNDKKWELQGILGGKKHYNKEREIWKI